ncbi:acyl carrier protein [Aurantiacibacter atlanticus]|uniref:acyl carrier protein n=1 Tax=Aurantiacibacter atlanticus TaxID=1648404 RepID=UPI00065F4140|nr:phosphopantetheine-binding protein [Aurantiacibacter atlanticus]
MASKLPVPVEETGEIDLTLRQVLQDVLGLSDERVAQLDMDSGLFGALPELDSMAVAGLLTEIEDQLDILVEDDEVDGEMLETFGGLLTYLVKKWAED